MVSRYNQSITERLLEGARTTLEERGAAAVAVIWVPGALEIPLAAQYLARSGRYDAILCLGCVIRGETLHFQLVAEQTAAGIARVALDTGVPIINEVLAVFDPADSVARSQAKLHRGVEGAHAAIHMAALRRELGERAEGTQKV